MKDNPRIRVDRRKRPRSIIGREERWYLFRVILLVALAYMFRREIFLYGRPLLVILPVVLAIGMLVNVFVRNERVSDVIGEQITIIPGLRGRCVQICIWHFK